MGCKGSQVRILSPRPITYVCVRKDNGSGTAVVPSVVPILNDVLRGDNLGQDERDSSAEISNVRILTSADRMKASIAAVDALPMRSQITLGGAPVG